MQEKSIAPLVKGLIEVGKAEKLRELIQSLSSSDIVELMESLPEDNVSYIFGFLNNKVAVKVFKVLEPHRQKSLLKSLTHEQQARLLNEIAPDDRTAFLEDLPSKSVNELIKLLSKEERELTLELLGYPKHSVGRLMTPNYIAVGSGWTVKKVLDYIRESGQNSETVNMIYVIDDIGILIDDIPIREFLFASPDKKVSDIMDHQYISLLTTDDEELAVKMFRNSNRFALPITDKDNVLLGCITIDDVLRLAEQEETEDIQKIGGMEVLREPYMNIPFLKLMKKRSGWLVVLFLGEMFTATAMGFFENELAKAVVLSLFLPLIISSGGNAGSQASTLIIRAMALGEVTLSDWWHIMRREIGSGLFLGILLGVIGFVRVVIWSNFTSLYGPHWILVALTVGFSLVGVVLWGTLVGSMLPLILRRFGADPAASSAPFVATMVDVTGLIIYFTVAFMVMRGTLL